MLQYVKKRKMNFQTLTLAGTVRSSPELEMVKGEVAEHPALGCGLVGHDRRHSSGDAEDASGVVLDGLLTRKLESATPHFVKTPWILPELLGSQSHR